MSSGFARFTLAACVLAFVVIVLGAYVRLSDAGLACPDWPGCYGKIVVPTSELDLAEAVLEFPDRPVETAKAWKEMAHRYFAGILGTFVAVLAVLAAMAWWRRGESGRRAGLSMILLALVVMQVLLGMWTVTLGLKPLVVTAHLLGGMATLALLWWLFLSYRGSTPFRDKDWGVTRLRPWLGLAVAVVVAQLTLGGWTSANYAALACHDFPLCRGQLWPPMDLSEAFRLWRELGVNQHGGALSHEALTGIQVSHRIGALLTFLYVGWVCAAVLRLRAGGALAACAGLSLLLLLTQIGLGAANVLLARPLVYAVAHNGVAALLLLAVLTQYHLSYDATTDVKL